MCRPRPARGREPTRSHAILRRIGAAGRELAGRAAATVGTERAVLAPALAAHVRDPTSYELAPAGTLGASTHALASAARDGAADAGGVLSYDAEDGTLPRAFFAIATA